ncbi:ABC transporter substrate-binding protein [Aquibacillus sp. 3ASR75-11]|uniref:ABC transporter substrate-binding protein n=2 Tax=Terrihalobacillus insolitus TaxID=2950438 RepID=A0A9X3WTS1_9BACI|nr:ABC transporter substrate-binding protein [Terrihalobacillus insolitus]MDC3412038.1 ABC transporter substrate-binding protein [Terrihalobacillus insolitus]MDC3423269.1 ABC transporter substrate-binding protein [Terrihalobacillus insolitus]
MFVFFLVACSSGDSSSEEGGGSEDATTEDTETSTETEEAGEEPVTIVYARGVDTTGATQLVIDAFEEQNPNIKVDFREMPSDTGQSHDQYVTMFSSQSSEVDVFDADVIWPAEFAQANYALELDRFIQKDGVDMSKYFPGTVAAANFNGKQWAMPKFTDAGILYYRTDIVDTPPKTWDELIEMASSLKGEAGTEFGYLMQAAQYEGLITNAIEFIASYGGQVIDEENNVVVNSPETIKAIEKMKEIVGSDFVPENILNFKETETENAWIQGKSVFARNWPYLQASSNDEERSSIVGNVDITTLPTGDAGSAAALGGWMAMINRYSEYPEEAWEFVKFMTGEEGQKIIAVDGGRAPTIKALYDDPEVQQSGPLFSNPEFVKVLESAVPRPVTPIYPVISDIMQIELSKALTGDQTPEEAAANMQTKIEEAISE